MRIDFFWLRVFLILSMVFLLRPAEVQAQCACSCNCGAGITKIWLKYNGRRAEAIRAYDGMMVLMAFPTGGTTLEIFGARGRNLPFVGKVVTIEGRFFNAFNINVECAPGLQRTSVIGDFTITLETMGQPVCCPANNPPVVSNCPANITLTSSEACGAAATWQPPHATDDCSEPQLTSTHQPGDFFAVGVTTVSYVATDDKGQQSVCSFTVTVLDAPPIFNDCPTVPLVFQVNSNSCKAMVVWPPPTATDNCDPSPMVAINATSRPPTSLLEPGSYNIEYIALDNATNASTCVFTVNVEDKTPPVFSGCPANVSVQTDAGSCLATVAWQPPAVVDNCTALPQLTASHMPGASLPPGVHTVAYEATDASGNRSTCSFTVSVVDATAPAFNDCPADIALVANDADCGAVASWTTPSAVDACSTLPRISSNHSPGDFFGIGTTTVTYTATDNADNTATCSFRVIVRSEAAPVIAGCPADMEVHVNELGDAPVQWEPPVASIPCGSISSFIASHAPGALFPRGTTRVEYAATSDEGMSATCSFNVVVVYDNIAIDVVKVVTPDGDGTNDEWQIKNIEQFGDNSVRIIDRWGSVVYQAIGYNNSTVAWTGTMADGSQAPTGTYFYYIEMNTPRGRQKKTGAVELLR